MKLDVLNAIPRDQAVLQEHSLGCSVACVAFRCGVSYQAALRFFREPRNAWVRGYYSNEVVEALAEAGLNYVSEEFDALKHSEKLDVEGTIVFIASCEKWPAGHYLIRAQNGWMNPWINFPDMARPNAGFCTEIPCKIDNILYEQRLRYC